MSDRNTNSEVVELKGDGNPPECVYPTSYGVPPNDVMQSPRNRNQFDVLVTNGWGRIAYNIVRSLGRRGLGIALGTDEFLGMALLSRYTTAHFHHPSIRNTAGFIESLKQAFRTFAPRVYLPSEQEVLVVSRFRDELDEYGVKIPIAPFETLCALHKKDALTDLAASLGVPTPETIVPKDLADVRAFAREIGDPVVVSDCAPRLAEAFFIPRARSSWPMTAPMRFAAFPLGNSCCRGMSAARDAAFQCSSITVNSAPNSPTSDCGNGFPPAA